MMNKIKTMWKKSTQNEKIMYALMLVLCIGIATRWAYVKTEVEEVVTDIFNSDTTSQEAIGKNGVPTFTVPEPPAMLPQSEAQKWVAKNFWNESDPSDYIRNGQEFTQILANWAMTLQVLSATETHAVVNAFFEKSKHDKSAVEMSLLTLEDVLYDPSVAVRNFEAYIAALKWVLAYDEFDELEKERSKSQLVIALRNRVGTKATDFKYVDINGQKSSLYNVKAKYTVVFINNPGCAACSEYKKVLMNDAYFVKMVDSKQLKVVGIFPDASEENWRKYSVDMPKSWINGFDYAGVISKNDLYDCSVIPSIYLLDKNKQVLLKDVNPIILVQYLQAI